MSYPNVANSSKYVVSFSNFPTLGLVKDMKLYDHYVRSCTLPDYNVVQVFSDFQSSRIMNPASRKNDDLSPLQIGFKMSEDGLNYYNILYFMQKLRYGQIDTETYRQSFIKRIDFVLLDNEKREKFKIYFTKAMPVSVTSVDMIYGVDEEIDFIMTFAYEEMLFEIL